MIPDLEAGSTVIAGRISVTEHLGCLGRVYWKRAEVGCRKHRRNPRRRKRAWGRGLLQLRSLARLILAGVEYCV
jgi:hypothetical protein